MAVSKRTRFEVLRRDNYTCRYCRSTDNTLTIDHVTPVALGGTDDPSNLVAACRDCNAGKSSSAPDSEIVTAVDEAAIRWARARAKVVEDIKRERAASKRRNAKFMRAWRLHDSRTTYLPSDWNESIDLWVAQGVDLERLCAAVDIAWGKTASVLDPTYVFRYIAGIVRNWIADIEERTGEQVKADEIEAGERLTEREEGYWDGWTALQSQRFGHISGGRLLEAHIDGVRIRALKSMYFPYVEPPKVAC